MSNKNKNPQYEGTCIFINEVGAISLRRFMILEKKEAKVKIRLESGESYSFKDSYIRARRVMIFKTSTGRIKVQNPDSWRKIDFRKYGIKELRFNLQNFSLQESKAAIHRWTMPPDLIAKLTPLFKLLMICIAVGVIGWAALKFGSYVLDVVMKARLLPCDQVLPRAPVPIGAVASNVTAPIGA